MKKTLLIMAALCMILTMGIATAQAGFYIVSIKATGATTGGSLIMCSDTAATPLFTNKWFVIDPSNSNPMLAAALTAVSAGMKCQLGVDAAQGVVPADYAYARALYLDITY